MDIIIKEQTHGEIHTHAWTHALTCIHILTHIILCTYTLMSYTRTHVIYTTRNM